MNTKETTLPRWFFGVLIAVAVFWALWHLFEFKDRFDSLAALFSGLAFVGLVGTLVYQKQELALQRQELADTRIVLKETADANSEAAKNALKLARAQYLLLRYQKMYDAKKDAFKHIKNDVVDHPPDYFETFKWATEELEKIKNELEELTLDVTDKKYRCKKDG